MVKSWNAYLPLRVYDPVIQEEFRDHARVLMSDLEHQVLRIGLIPAREPKFDDHKEFAVESENPSWYSQLWNQYAYAQTRKSGNHEERYVRKRGPKGSKIQKGPVMKTLGIIALGTDQKASSEPTVYERSFPVGRKRINREVLRTKHTRYIMHVRLRTLIFDHLTKGYVVEGKTSYPSLGVCSYFGVKVPKGIKKELMLEHKRRVLDDIPF